MLRNTKFYSLLASATIVCAVAFAPLLQAASQLDIKASKPQQLPAITYLDENGREKTVDTASRRLTAIHFWATWCVPCVDEIPEIDKVFKDYEARGMQLVVLSVDGKANLPKVKQFYAEHGIKSIKVALDNDMQVFQAAKVRGLPTTLFIDNNGMEIARAEGVMDWRSKANEEAIELLLR